MFQDSESTAEFALPDGFALDDLLSHPEALEACLTGWGGVGEREPVEARDVAA
jgi:hypothetical protein